MRTLISWPSPFFNLCDDDGNIAYLDFSRMRDGEPLVTIAYFGTNGIVFTGKTDDDFSEYLLKKLNEDPLSEKGSSYRLTEGNARALLEYWPSSEEQIKYKKKNDPTEYLLTNQNPDTASTEDYVFYRNTTNPVPYKPSMIIGGVTYENVFMLKPGETVVINFPTFAIVSVNLSGFPGPGDTISPFTP